MCLSVSRAFAEATPAIRLDASWHGWAAGPIVISVGHDYFVLLPFNSALEHAANVGGGFQSAGKINLPAMDMRLTEAAFSEEPCHPPGEASSWICPPTLGLAESWTQTGSNSTPYNVGIDITHAVGLVAPESDLLMYTTAVDEEPPNGAWTTWDKDLSMDDFFAVSGAWRPPVPCDYCSKMRVQCISLRTTSANPNPVTACSSCVALFRDCSLAERRKRPPSTFETAVPVIGYLHGINESDDWSGGGSSGIIHPPAAVSVSVRSNSKRARSRTGTKTSALRHWFASHQTEPYPTEEEKVLLAQQSGLSKTQVSDWFANARRRRRQSAQASSSGKTFFPRGSPMPRSNMANLTPLERWRNSPPEEEPVSMLQIQQALDSLPDRDYTSSSVDSGIWDGNLLSNSQNSDFNRQIDALFASSDSASSACPIASLDGSESFTGSGQARPSAWPSVAAKGYIFQCTFCHQSFKKKHDWLRHETAVHMPGLDSWVCAVPLALEQQQIIWRIDQSRPECIFCGHPEPTAEHFRSHAFEACAKRPLAEHTFARKDHLWQHLRKFHGCKRWAGWQVDLKILQSRHDTVHSRCGFCQDALTSWDQRAQHLTAHFRAGLTMAQWTGDSKIESASLYAGSSQTSDLLDGNPYDLFSEEDRLHSTTSQELITIDSDLL